MRNLTVMGTRRASDWFQPESKKKIFLKTSGPRIFKNGLND